MRKSIIFILFMMLSVCALMAQSVQKVRVVEYKGEGAKTPLANVEVVVGNAGSVVTDRYGMCTLIFRTLKPGDKVTVRRVAKDGYEVLNTDLLDQWFVSRNSAEEYVIVMTKSKRIKAERDKYMQAAQKSISKAMSNEQTIIGKQFDNNLITKAEYEKRMRQLRVQYNEQLDNIDNYIDHMVHSDINEVAEQEKKVFKLMKQGNVDGALAEYEKINLLGVYQQQMKDRDALVKASERIESEKRKITSEYSQLYSGIKRQNDLLRMAGGVENIEAGFKLWHDFAYADTTCLLPLYEYAHYCEKSNRLADALDALHYCSNSSDTVMSIRADLLRIQIMTKRSQHYKVLPELVSIYQYMDSVKIARHDSSVFLTERAYALSLLCKANLYIRDFDKALKYAPLSVEVNRQLFEWDKSNLEGKRQFVDALYHSHSVNHTYSLQEGIDTVSRIKGFQDTLYLSEAIRLQKEMYDADHTKQAAMYAFLRCEKIGVVRNIAFYQNDTTRLDEMDAEYRDVISLYKEAYDHNPKAYAHYLATAYYNWGLLHSIIGEPKDWDMIIDLYQKALVYATEEFEYNPGANRRTYAHILNKLGSAYFSSRCFPLAEQYTLKAINELLSLYQQYPKTFKVQLRGVYSRLIMLYSPDALNDPEEQAQAEATLKGLGLDK